jgi:hypothetical protein
MTLANIWRRGRRPAHLALAGCAVAALAACDDLVNFADPDELPPEAINNAAGAQALYAGALRSFGRAFAGDAGGTEGQALISGMVADEWLHSGTFSTRVDYDRRAAALENSTLEGAFRFLQQARIDADRAITAMLNTGAVAATDSRIAEMYNRMGAVFVYGAQNYCSGISFSNIIAGQPVYGLQLSTSEMLDSANFYFDRALAGPAGTNSINHNIARLHKARILMMRGPAQFAQAATLVAAIPTTFRAINEHSTINGGTENGIFVFNTQNERFTVSHREGGNGLPFRGADPGTNPALADPRVPWTRTGGGTDVGFDNATPQYDLLLYTTRAQATVWAKGEEARLIEAEAALQAGNVALWLQKLNELRANVAGLAPLADPGTASGRVDLLFSERAFWLFTTGTRLMDLRRLIRQYGRTESQVFPTGVYPRPGQGGNYGTDVNLPVPTRENQNPSLGATTVLCLDRNA